MPDRVLVVCPSRERPKSLANLVHSVLNTSEKADVHAYLDDDQATLYSWCREAAPARFRVTMGPRIGPTAAANQIVLEHLNAYEAFCFVPDDAVFTIPGWDKKALSVLTDTVGVYAPSHRNQDIDMPVVSRKWVAALGWLCWPGLYHWGWPSVIAALGFATRTLTRAKPCDFWIDHPAGESMNREKYPADIINLYDYFANEFEPSLETLRRAL